MTKSVKKRKRKKGRKTYKFRYGDAARIEYLNKEDLIRALRELASRGELVGPTANMLSHKVGFAEYKAVRVHLLDKEMSNDEIRAMMDEVENVVREEKARPEYMRRKDAEEKNDDEKDVKDESCEK
jgi:hypothetical protein